ncbi:MAG: FAD-binding oxidoreductase [Chloroflexi bacterium]|nr:FAD-binding oxidoreductase [Chloroflexota bacterium]
MDLSAALESVLDSEARLDPAAFALGGRTPRAAFAPRSAEEVAEVLRACAAEKLAVRPWGGGAHRPATAPARFDVALSLARFDRVVDYEPGDLTCTLGAGLTLQRAGQEIAAHGQELPLESAHVHRATVGGVCAANASGARRAWLGSPRDRVLGMRFVTGDGVMARSGGRVVKNVAGYGIHRLLCGSNGALAVILEASFKLLPSPQQRVALVYALGSEPPATERLCALRASRQDPSVLTALDPAAAAALGGFGGGGAWTLILGLEADAPWVAEQERIAAALLGAPTLRLSQEEAASLWQRLSDLDGPGDDLLLSAAVPPARAAEALQAIHQAGARAAWVHVPSGGLRARFAASGEAAARAAIESLHALGGVPQSLPGANGFAAARDAGEPAIASLRDRLRGALDPAGTLSV